MDRQDWDGIYSELEGDMRALARRSGDADDDIEVARHIDRARFAIDKGDHARAIEIIEDIRQYLQESAEPTRGGAAPPSVETLEALEDYLISETRFATARLEVLGEEEIALPPPTRAGTQNATVNRSIKFEDIAEEYVVMFDSARIRPEKLSDVRWYSNKVVAGREVYEKIEAKTNVPWYFVGLIHGMECSFALSKHLHNGDSLKARTWQVPKGRPKEGSPPFTFEASACDALAYDNLAGQADWSLARMLYRLEVYNGFGYRKKLGTASPYLWSYSSHFNRGKYVQDGAYDSNALSKQCGAAVMLKDLVERGIVVINVPKPPPPPPPEPLPEPVPEAAAQPGPAPQPEPTVQPEPVVPTEAAPAMGQAEPGAAPADTVSGPTPEPTQGGADGGSASDKDKTAG
jgi:lysozyme family protein